MIFDFDRFTTIAKLAYRRLGNCAFSFNDALGVFRHYFETFELVFGKAHPMISVNQTFRIMEKMPTLSDGNDYEYGGIYGAELTPEDYKPMIDQHFSTGYWNCDFNINHFFSGVIRNFRYAEVLILADTEDDKR